LSARKTGRTRDDEDRNADGAQHAMHSFEGT
jgi:hypothetical protein